MRSAARSGFGYLQSQRERGARQIMRLGWRWREGVPSAPSVTRARSGAGQAATSPGAAAPSERREVKNTELPAEVRRDVQTRGRLPYAGIFKGIQLQCLQHVPCPAGAELEPWHSAVL